MLALDTFLTTRGEPYRAAMSSPLTGERACSRLSAHLALGALSGRAVWQLTLKGNSVSAREELFKDAFGRIRDVRQGPDGWLYLLTDDDNGKLIRIEQ